MIHRIRYLASRYRRKACEQFGIDWYSRPSLSDIGRKLEAHLPATSGVYIEAGANDGFSQSNTYYLEKFRGWRGILVEPIPNLYRACVKERPDSVVFPCALVSDDFPDTNVEMTFANLMSIVKGARNSPARDRAHVERGVQIQRGVDAYELTVPARTLSSLIDATEFEQIDFLSLDVEGYELQVLQGIDWERHAPKVMLVEATKRAEIESYIKDRYETVDVLSDHDVLYRKRQ